MNTQSMKFKLCCAPYCTNSQAGKKKIGVNGKILSFHKFPQTDSHLYARWVSFCCFLNQVPADPILCSDHFENEDISLENVGNDRVIRVLWPHAAPTIQTRKGQDIFSLMNKFYFYTDFFSTDRNPLTCAVRGCNFSNTTNGVKHLYQFPKPAL